MAKDSPGNDAHQDTDRQDNSQTVSAVKKRSIISQQDVKRTLLASAGFTRPEVRPLTERLVSQQPTCLKEALQPLKQGVAYAAELIHNLEDAHPARQQEKAQHAIRISDTIHLLEGLQKALEKETKNLFSGHNQPEIGLKDETAENHALYLESSTLLNTLKSHIQTLENMEVTATE